MFSTTHPNRGILKLDRLSPYNQPKINTPDFETAQKNRPAKPGGSILNMLNVLLQRQYIIYLTVSRAANIFVV